MSILSRAFEIAQAKINNLLNKAENPNEILDLSYEKMLAGLQEIKVHLADVVTEQKQLENKITQAQQTCAQRDEEAKAALKLGKEELARQALEIKQNDVARLTELQSAYTNLTAEVEKLKAAERKFQQRIEDFRDQKEVTKASYTAANAQAKINESLSGAGKAFGGVGDAMQRAKDKTAQMQAKAQALDSLTEEGILNDPLDNRNSVTRELDAVRKQSNVDDELAKLKADLNDKS